MGEPPRQGKEPFFAAEELGRILFEAAPLAFFFVDAQGWLLAMNPQAQSITGWQRKDYCGTRCRDLFGCGAEDGRCTCVEAARHGQRFLRRLARSDGSLFTAELVSFPLEVRGYQVFGVALLRDVSAEERQRRELERRSYRDSLTGLGNRYFLEQVFRRPELEHGGVALVVDLDGMKEINDRFGHPTGDQALQLTARALEESLRENDFVARYGGDEFLILLPGAAVADAKAVLERIRAVLERYREEFELPYPLRLSCGTGRWSREERPSAALRRADRDLYRDKGIILVHGDKAVRLTEEGRRRAGEDLAAVELLRQAKLAASFDAYDGLDELLRQIFLGYAQVPREFLDWLGLEEGASVLEAGCGGGRLTVEGGLAARVGRRGLVIATDPSPTMLRQARRKCEAAGLTQVRFLLAAAERLPLVNAQVDWAVGINFLHYTDPEAALAELRRVTRPGGGVGVVVFTGADFPAVVGKPVKLLSEAVRARGAEPGRLWNPPGSIPELFGRVGLEAVESRAAAETVEFATAANAARFLRQTALFEALGSNLPEDEAEELTLRAMRELRVAYRRATAADRRGRAHWEFVRGRVSDS
ncbi:MAG: diguanylate cyclase [Thermaerobacter sp.]|nr:diguanylate cyclase [Thermaerobacter sp.]